MSGFGNLKPRTGQKDSVRLEEVIELHKWPADEWSQVRFLPGKILPVKRHWIKILAGRDKKEISIPRYCIAFDPNNEDTPRRNADGEDIHCPYCDLAHGGDNASRYEFFYLANAIIRELQEDMPRRANKIERTKEEKKTGFKDIRSKTWTPVRVCRITSSVAARMQELNEGNTVKNKKTGVKKAYDITDVKYGIDVRVKYKPKASGTDKYSADKDERTPLTDEEQAYLTWRLDESLLDITGRMDEKQAKEDFKRMEVVGSDTPDEDDEDGYSLDDDDEPKGKKSKKSDKKAKKKPFDDDDEDDEDDEDDDDAPPKKSSKDKKSKSKSKEKVKSSKDKKPKKKKPVVKDDDDEDDEPPKKSSKDKVKKSAKSSKKDKAEKSSKKSKDKPSKKKKKASAWQDDD